MVAEQQAEAQGVHEETTRMTSYDRDCRSKDLYGVETTVQTTSIKSLLLQNQVAWGKKEGQTKETCVSVWLRQK